jgi:hypothetical protein
LSLPVSAWSSVARTDALVLVRSALPLPMRNV